MNIYVVLLFCIGLVDYAISDVYGDDNNSDDDGDSNTEEAFNPPGLITLKPKAKLSHTKTIKNSKKDLAFKGFIGTSQENGQTTKKPIKKLLATTSKPEEEDMDESSEVKPIIDGKHIDVSCSCHYHLLPVCGNNGLTYPNLCQFTCENTYRVKVAQLPPIKLACNDVCERCPNPPEFNPKAKASHGAEISLLAWKSTQPLQCIYLGCVAMGPAKDFTEEVY